MGRKQESLRKSNNSINWGILLVQNAPTAHFEPTPPNF
jgi:hypothetical protein